MGGMQVMPPPRRARRHVYLPGFSAFDTAHRKAATMEMGHQGEAEEFRPGAVFVDTPQARQHALAAFEQRRDSVVQRLSDFGVQGADRAKLRREYRGLRAAARDIRVIDPQAQGFGNQDAGPADLLFVKGHGNPRNPNSISTRATPVNMALDLAPGDLGPRPSKLRVKRGFKAVHPFDEVAQSVHHIAAAVDSPGLDVRITSCGSGGTVSREDVAPQQRDLTQTFAGQVSAHLDQLQTDPRVRVSGYQGDSNSSLPRTQGGDGFVTTIKQLPENAAAPERFVNAMERQQARLGPLTETTKHREIAMPDSPARQQILQQIPAPAPLQVSPALAQRAQVYTRVTVATDQDIQMVASGPRAAARVSIPRQ